MSNVHMIDDTDSGDSGGLGDDFGSDLDRIVGDLDEYAPKPFRLVHPLLAGYTLEFRGDLLFEDVEKWRRKATTKRGRNGEPDVVDAALASAMIVAGACTGIFRGDAPVEDGHGDRVLFGSVAFQAKLLPNVSASLRTAAAAARKFLVTDAAVGSLANKVVEVNGFGGDVEEAPDPTGSAS